VLKAECVVIQRKRNHFADNEEHEHKQKKCQAVVLSRSVICEITKAGTPVIQQQGNEQPETDDKVANLCPALGAIVLARFERIGLEVRSAVHKLSMKSRASFRCPRTPAPIIAVGSIIAIHSSECHVTSVHQARW